jgi:phytoene desaturase
VEVDKYFRSPALRELMYGFPTYCGFDPRTAPASLMLLPWTILREGVWYPAEGGIAAIPRALARACREVGVEIRTQVEVESIDLDAEGNVCGVTTDSGPISARMVVSNSDYVHTHRMLRGGKGFSSEVADLREGKAEPSCSFFTLQLGCNRTWERLAHHLIVLTRGSENVYDEVYLRGEYPADPPLYINSTSVTDPADAPEGGSNPFVVLSVPSIHEGQTLGRDFVERYADRLMARLEEAGLDGLSQATVSRTVMSPEDFRQKFHLFRGAIYGLSSAHNILGGGFRPLNFRKEFPGLYFVGGCVQPGAGLPMAIQSGKITAEKVAKDARTFGWKRQRPVPALAGR